MKKSTLCENCIHFVQHYSILNCTAYKVPYGHCSITKNQAGRKRKFECKNFKALNVNTVELERNYIKELLNDVNIKLSQINEYIETKKD